MEENQIADKRRHLKPLGVDRIKYITEEKDPFDSDATKRKKILKALETGNDLTLAKLKSEG